MILEKTEMTLKILENNDICCGDGGVGHFLNIVATKLYKNNIDFTKFKTETWERSRRKVLEENKHLDLRTNRTSRVEAQIKREVS